LRLLAATFNDNVEVKLVGERKREEWSENIVLKLDGGKIFFEAARIDDDLAGAFGHPDASYSGFAAAGGALCGGGGHFQEILVRND
jgi:hypothetical protein